MTGTFPAIRAGAEPFFSRGGPVGCLVLHGFMASPAEIRWLCQHLAAQGHTVYGPRLPGHGLDERDMARLRWHDWYAAALDGYHLLRAQCQQVIVVGHSMGGVLALLVGANMPADGLAVLAAPIRLTHWMARNAHRLQVMLPYTTQADTSTLPEVIRAEQSRRGEPVLGRVRYERWSTAAVSQLYRLVQVAYDRLPDVTAPLLLVYSKADVTVALDNQAVIASRVRSASIQQATVDHSDHILIQDTERDIVFQHVANFITAHTTTTQL